MSEDYTEEGIASMERRYENRRRPEPANVVQSHSNRRHWERFYRHLVMAVGGLAITVTVLGVLVTPVIMSLVYTWVWMFLYLAYLIVGLVSWAFIIKKEGNDYEDY